jgi:Uncharacterized alpha/beta hydrolase domain (DUF2235)
MTICYSCSGISTCFIASVGELAFYFSPEKIMAKTWIVCIDGTWNQPGQRDKDPVSAEESATSSNVVRIWEALADRALARTFYYGSIAPIKPKILFTGVEGEVIYLAGIGTSGTVKHQVLEGATGTGTSERIRDAYRFLAERCRPGDRIFAFGFSRGAFAVRSLAGFIDLAGLPMEPRALKEEEVLDLYDAYMDTSPIDKSVYGTVDAAIDFLGVWDTVSALAFGRTLGNFHRISPANVKRVAHALALDEERERFEPAFWELPATAETRVDEVWFSGCHTNIGGGYVDANLSNIALFWMLQSARDAGLPLDARGIPGFDVTNPRALARDSYKEFYDCMGLIGKIAISLDIKKGPRAIRAGQRIHQSVIDRMQQAGGAECYVPAARYHGTPLTVDANPEVQPWGGF